MISRWRYRLLVSYKKNKPGIFHSVYCYGDATVLDKSIREETISFAQEIIRVNSPFWHEEGVAVLVERKMQALEYDSVRVDSFGNVIGIRIGKHPGPVILFDGHMDAALLEGKNLISNFIKYSSGQFS